jgi:competence protein ComEA
MKKQIYDIPKRKIALTAVVFCVFICLMTGGCKKEQPEWEMILGEEQTASQGTSSDNTSTDIPNAYSGSQSDQEVREEATICVYVCGAVQNPGIAALPAGSRANDAVAMVGGFTHEADDSYVNLAAYVADGEMIYIPTKEESVQLKTAEQTKAKGLVNINTADSEALCTLPGIGESRAQDIIRYRQEQGGFASPEDIMQVPGIKEAAFAKMKDYIVVN